MRSSQNVTIPIASLLALILLIGCGTSDDEASSSLPTSTLDKTPLGTLPSDEECKSLAANLIEALENGDVSKANGLINWGALLKTSTDNINVEREVHQDFIEWAKKSAPDYFIGFLANAVGAASGKFDLLRIRDGDGHKKALFRAIFHEKQGGLNYYEFYVVKEPSGSLVVIDVLDFDNSETWSDLHRLTFLERLSSKHLSSLMGRDKDVVEHDDKLQEAAQHLRAGNAQAAYDVYNNLPKTLRETKWILKMRLQAAMALDEPLYMETIDDLRGLFPDDPSIDMISIDWYIKKKKYDKALEAINRLEKAIGGDPYLNVLRAGIHLDQKDSDKAIKLSAKAAEQLPDLLPALFMALDVSVKAKRFDETNKWLIKHRELQRKRGRPWLDDLGILTERGREILYSTEDLTRFPEYTEYVESPQYQDWLKIGGKALIK